MPVSLKKNIRMKNLFLLVIRRGILTETKSPEEVTFFAEEMKAFLAGKQVKMIIAACNTITFSVPPSFFAGKIPVIGMSLDFPELESVNHLAVIGTPMTIRSHRHRDRLKKDFPLMNVTEIPIDGLAYAIEMGKRRILYLWDDKRSSSKGRC